MTNEQIREMYEAADALDLKLTGVSVALSQLRARLRLALDESEGRPQSRESRLARVLLAEPWDGEAYDRILREAAP